MANARCPLLPPSLVPHCGQALDRPIQLWTGVPELLRPSSVSVLDRLVYELFIPTPVVASLAMSAWPKFLPLLVQLERLHTLPPTRTPLFLWAIPMLN